LPLYDFRCNSCGQTQEYFLHLNHPNPICCGEAMRRLYSVGKMKIKSGYPIWVDRMDEIHKRQKERGEKLRYVHPKEIRAT
jgi:putative FmdB family regulatory protein